MAQRELILIAPHAPHAAQNGRGRWSILLVPRTKKQQIENTNAPKISLNQFFVVAAFVHFLVFWPKSAYQLSVPVILVALNFIKEPRVPSLSNLINPATPDWEYGIFFASKKLDFPHPFFEPLKTENAPEVSIFPGPVFSFHVP